MFCWYGYQLSTPLADQYENWQGCSSIADEPVNDELSHFRGKTCKVDAETRYAHNQVRKEFRVFIRFDHLLLIEDVDIDLRASQIEVARMSAATLSTLSGEFGRDGSRSICSGAVFP